MRYIFGHKPSTEPGEFVDKPAALDFLHYGLPDGQAFRYRSTRSQRTIESIIFSFGGNLLAELVIAKVQKPQSDDLASYSKARKVYLIDEIRFFTDDSLFVSDFDLTPSQWGIKVPDEIYAQIIARRWLFGDSQAAGVGALRSMPTTDRKISQKLNGAIQRL